MSARLKTLLLAEHHAPTRQHLSAALAQAGFTVRAVGDPGPALELFVSYRPDGVLVAVDFPKLDGAHLGKLIRGSDRGLRIPMIAIDKAHLGKARGVGAILDIKADAYIPDPTRSQELIDRLRQLASAAQARAANPTSGTDVTLSRSPVAAGELKGYPLPPLLHSFYRVSRDGILVVAARDLTRRVFLVGGRPIHYDSTARQDALPQYLVESSELSPTQADTLARLLASGKPVGTALYQAGLGGQGEDLLQRLRDYLKEKVAQVVGMREGRYAFYAGAEFAKDVPSVEIPALAPLLEGARRTFPVKVFGQALKGRAQEFPTRSPEFGKDLPALGLDTQDLKSAMQLNGRIPLSELIAHGRGGMRQSYSLLWFLSLTGDIAFSKAPVAGPEHPLAPTTEKISPRKRKPLPAEVLTHLRDQAVKIITGSYFRVLGLDITADTEAVERAYHQTSTEFHPDTYAEYDTSSIQDLLESVQDKLSASYRVLSVEEKRKAYVQYLLSRLDARSSVVNAEAEIALKRGEMALRKKDLRGALRAFEEAVGLNPREPEYYSYLAWATYQAGAGDKADRAKAAQKLLRKALGLNAYLERPLVISAIIDVETGERDSARKKVNKVLEMNPSSPLAKATLRRIAR